MLKSRFLPFVMVLAIFGSVIAAILAGCGGSNGSSVSSAPNTATTGLPPAANAQVGFPNGPATLAQVLRGRYIVTSAGCADCHSHGVDDPNDPNWMAGYIYDPTINPLNIGQFEFPTPVGGLAVIDAMNITPDLETGIGDHTPQELFTSLTTGHHERGTLCPPMPWPDLAAMAPEDLWSIIAYLKSIKPVHNEVPFPTGIGNDQGDCSAFYPPGFLPSALPPFPAGNEVGESNTSGPGLPNGPATLAQVQHGRYVVTAIGLCAACHNVGGLNTPDSPFWLAGYVNDPSVNPGNLFGVFPEGPLTTFATNLTPDPTGIGNLSDEQVYQAIHNGIDPKTGHLICPPMPWNATHNMVDTDTWAIIAYLRHLKPVSNVVPPNQGPGGSVPDCTAFYPPQLPPIPAFPAGNEVAPGTAAAEAIPNSLYPGTATSPNPNM